MANKNADSSQPQVVQTQQQPPSQQQKQHGEACGQPPPQQFTGSLETRSRGGNPVIKSGPLFLSSKGIGWTSWKKRWFVLTRTSLVFSRSDPTVSQKGSEVNLTLGGIDLNSSGSVVVKADKRLLTVLFPDGRDGRAFTLKAETMDDLHEWKAALENALAQAPSASLVMGQNGLLRNENSDTANNLAENQAKVTVRSTIIGTPILLALEDVDGTPSFLEKALRFVETHGVKVEGILRQAADVDDVERRIREYEQGKNDFVAAEDAHIIADCVKYVLRELPSSPVPASCCNALIEACRTDRGSRVNAMRVAICETFPEPNRRLLQRILMMMQIVASHKTENRMSISAVAACMAPLLLRPLLSGDCEIENDFDVGGDGSLQLLQAAAAANHAQAIVITLLEEYDNIFGEGTLSQDLYSDSDESGSETEEATDDDEYDDEDYDEDDGRTNDSEEYTDSDAENMSNGTCSESGASGYNDLEHHDTDDDKVSDDLTVESGFQEKSSVLIGGKNLSSSSRRASLLRRDDVEKSETISSRSSDNSKMQASPAEMIPENKSVSSGPVSSIQKCSTVSNRPGFSSRQWGRTPGKKNLSTESIDFLIEEETVEIQTLEGTKLELQSQIAEEIKCNGVLHAALERRKTALLERRQALEKEVARLQEELQKERDKRSALEAGLNASQGRICIPEGLDDKVKKDLEDIAKAESDITNLEQKVNNLEGKLNQQNAASTSSLKDSSIEAQRISDNHEKLKDRQKDFEAAATPFLERSALQETQWDEKESGTEKQLFSSSITSKHSRQTKPQQGTSRDSPKLVGAITNSPRRPGTKNEGTNTTASALSKLTMRLNFLKERRSQIANELQNMDKGRPFDQPSSVSDKSRASENRQSSQILETGRNASSSNSENSKKPSYSSTSSGSRSDMDPVAGCKRSDSQNNTHNQHR